MKVFRNGKVYVQVEDLLTVTCACKNIPKSILRKFFAIKQYNIDEYLEFIEDDEIEFFKSLYWVIDYDCIKTYSIEELHTLLHDIENRLNRLNKDYDLYTEENPDYKYGFNKVWILDVFAKTIRKVLFFKENNLDLHIPKDTNTYKLIRKIKHIFGK